MMLMQVVGAALSPALTGMIAGSYSFVTAFSVLSLIALVALVIWWRGASVLMHRSAHGALQTGAD